MDTILKLGIAILPVAFLWMYVWKQDTKKEPLAQLLKGLIYGALICIPVVFVESAISMLLIGPGGEPQTLGDTTLLSFLGAALPEEGFKLLALWLLLRKNPYFDEHFDGVVYAVCVGLGFAAVENAVYVMPTEDWMSVGFSRALLAVPGHYAFAVMMGYYYSVHHFIDHSPKTAVMILLVPVIAHGIYDSLALSGMVDPLIGGLSFVVLILFCVRMHKIAYQKVVTLVMKDRKSRV